MVLLMVFDSQYVSVFVTQYVSVFVMASDLLCESGFVMVSDLRYALASEMVYDFHQPNPSTRNHLHL